jgi:hypothetical protein
MSLVRDRPDLRSHGGAAGGLAAIRAICLVARTPPPPPGGARECVAWRLVAADGGCNKGSTKHQHRL